MRSRTWRRRNRRGRMAIMPRTSIRSVLRGVAVVAALLVAAEHPFTAADSHYTRVDNWAQLPPGYAWGTMSAVAIDAQGNVYGFQRDDPTSKVIVFDAHGKH